MSLTRTLIDVRPLRTSPAFRRLLFGRTASVLGSFMAMVAVMYQVWDMTHSTVWTGAVGLAQALPMVVVGLFGGSLADRGDRRRIFLVATVGQGVCSLLLAVQAFLGHVPVAVVLALLAVHSCFGSVSGPAAGVFVPRLLPKEEVAAGLALNQISAQAMMLLGPALGGLVLGWTGAGVCYLLDALSFALAFYGAFGLPSLPPDGEPSRTGVHGVLDGLRFLAGHRVVRGALLTDLSATVLAMPMGLFPLVNAERFGGSPRTLGLFLSAVAVGGVTASALSGSITRFGRPGLVMLCGSGTWGGALVLFGLTSSPWAGLGLLVLAGAADTTAVISRSTIVQTRTPDALLGRVTAAEQIVGQGGPNLGNLRGGLVAGWTSGTVALVSGGLLCLLAVVFVGASTPELREHAEPGVPHKTTPELRDAAAPDVS
ncbi:MFS transporter [Streptomyces sp. NPDC093228]|uniref:MFS transporter n=1 Tax=unclassified Streptomyces TaxID=2593676 RepID=UPI000E24E506|nr:MULTISPECIES: MFS transporter [unclassified Streptomyces]MDX3262450.1 MFS transporter [Streptomyces sp. MI02-2A]REE60913.1 putative MFS family arabinose efflux permease [Streptomyces sp. 3212.3]